ncbi:type 4 pilus major pilin [Chromobacterium vaccinii]|uniref:type 4 pilus major pilin n=1 Tax=Chromobacterium vaccinii TaxID=1108595 RepID=UPI001E2E4257|nr:type 4 pilus major pilin [Chromobacterium vaccinii]MCD4500493.1 hypothetical protein [Chromobacterium vaccinii]
MLLNGKEKNCSQCGLSLIEAAMVLALSAVVVAGAVMYYGSASDNSKVQRAQSQIGTIQSAVASLYANQGSYTGLNSDSLKSGRMLPTSYLHTVAGSSGATTTIVNPWKGLVTVDVDTRDATTYNLVYQQVPAGACVKLLTSELGTSLRRIGTASITGGAANANLPIPVTLSAATAACGTGTATLTFNLA